MADEATKETQENGGNQIYYLLGAVVLAAIVVAGYFLRSKTNLAPVADMTTPVVSTPTPGPISALSCEKKYYNPVVGFPKYYLSVEGVDLPNASKVDCTFTISSAGKVVATESAQSPLTPAPERNGSTFRCTTKATAVTPSVVTKIDYEIKDDLGKTATCSANFTLPAP